MIASLQSEVHSYRLSSDTTEAALSTVAQVGSGLYCECNM